MARFSTLTSILATGGIIVGAVLVSPQPAEAGPGLAAVDLEKTVMIDSGSDVCGTETALTVGVGTTVRYCYTITNVGNIPLDSHTLIDDQLGTVLGPDHPYVLDPAGSISITVTHLVTETVTNTATVTSANNQFEIFLIEATDSVTVTATPPSISLDKTVMIDTGSDVCGTDTALTVGVGTMVRYCYTVTNIGLTPLTEHTLIDDQLGNVLTDFALVLDPGASTSVTGTAMITSTVTNTATWTAQNNSLEIYDIEATDNLTVTATPSTITLDKTVMVDNGNDECGTADALAVEAGTTVRYCYTVTNTGLTPLTEHSLVDDRLGTLLSGFVLTLDPGASTSVTETAVVTDAVTNVATWTAENNSLEVYGITATDDLTVTITVPTTTTTTTTTVAPTTTTTSIQGILPPTGPTSPIPIALMVGLMMAGLGALALARTRQRPAG